MGDFAIRVENLGKLYRIGQRRRYKTFGEALTGAICAPFRSARAHLSGPLVSESSQELDGTIWALKGVSFEVKHGEIIGIIGRNGAGKSTLLKILSRITIPTEGYAEISGRVGSLLEVGTGFHGDLTGRENIYLNGAILGMKKAEIDRKFDEIVAFAETERFLDTPVKHYSSGMYLRLAFAVAAHLEPEILLVDEVLAVGDAVFQKKCLGKMDDVAKQGRTVLFVSHNLGAINRLCQRALWLDHGKIALDGPSNEVVSRYQTKYLTPCPAWKRAELKEGSGHFAFLSVAVIGSQEQPKSCFGGDEPVTVEIRYIVRRSLSGCQIGTRVYNTEGLVVLYTSDADTSGFSALAKEPGCYRTVFTIPGRFLAPGGYQLMVAAHLPSRCVYEVIEQAVVFEVSVSGSLSSLDGRLGVVSPLFHWETAKQPLS